MAAKIGGGAVGASQMPQVTGIEGAEVNVDINMTPMIDVMLVLLIIFMVITPALAAYAAELPKAYTAAPEKDDRVTLGIDRAGRFFVDENSRPVPEDRLAEVLVQAYEDRPEDQVLYLKADRGVEYSVILTAIDAARVAGVARIGAITEQARVAEEEG